MKKSEYGLFIIWQNARNKQEEIINDIKKRFSIINIFEIEWNKKLFSKNLTKFYGTNLPKKSSKEKHVGNGKFILLILKDNNPIYGYRNTSKGGKYLNVNFFDSKTLYRSWTGKHMVHGTNDEKEFKHDLMMLLGLNIEDYLKTYKKSNKIVSIKRDTAGFNGWKDLKEVLYVLNETIEYVVLRNFAFLPEKYETGEHSDIDILCSNINDAKIILNAELVKKSKKRVRSKVKVGNSFIYFDLRNIGDNYYDKNWETEILLTRRFNGKFYTPNKENYKMSLLYHALIQKIRIASDYKEILKKEFKTDKINELKNILFSYLELHDYRMTVPNDYSVFYNKNITNKSSYLHEFYHLIPRKIKDLIKL